MTSRMVHLKNGTIVSSSEVKVLMRKLKRLLQDDPRSFDELVQICRDPHHIIADQSSRQTLKDLNLIKDFYNSGHGDVRNFVRSVVISAVEGTDNIGFKIVQPFRRPRRR